MIKGVLFVDVRGDGFQLVPVTRSRNPFLCALLLLSPSPLASRRLPQMKRDSVQIATLMSLRPALGIATASATRRKKG
jgi:hypothetical protein